MSKRDLHGITIGDEGKSVQGEQKLGASAGYGPHETVIPENITPRTEQGGFVVKVKGVVVTQSFGDRMLAEQYLAAMPAPAQVEAEIVQVNSQGQEILLG